MNYLIDKIVFFFFVVYSVGGFEVSYLLKLFTVDFVKLNVNDSLKSGVIDICYGLLWFKFQFSMLTCFCLL